MHKYKRKSIIQANDVQVRQKTTNKQNRTYTDYYMQKQNDEAMLKNTRALAKIDTEEARNEKEMSRV